MCNIIRCIYIYIWKIGNCTVFERGGTSRPYTIYTCIYIYIYNIRICIYTYTQYSINLLVANDKINRESITQNVYI